MYSSLGPKQGGTGTETKPLIKSSARLFARGRRPRAFYIPLFTFLPRHLKHLTKGVCNFIVFNDHTHVAVA